jgi:hypothetical protein
VLANLALNRSGNVKFSYSLVIALCDSSIHTSESGSLQTGFYRMDLRSVGIATGLSQPPGVNSSQGVTLDLHTKTTLIARKDVDVKLAYLQLEQEILNGYLDIYAVERNKSPDSPDFDIQSKDQLYRLSDLWV